MSKEEEEQAWQKAIKMMLSGEGLDALGLDASGNAKPSGSAPPRPSSSKTEPNSERGPKEEKPDFNETIRRTMEQLKQGGSSSQQNAGGGDLAALLAELGADPSALNGLGEGDDDLSGLLDGMMAQLMNKEVLEEPMSELAAKVSARSFLDELNLIPWV
jgi:peroxin-19